MTDFPLRNEGSKVASVWNDYADIVSYLSEMSVSSRLSFEDEKDSVFEEMIISSQWKISLIRISNSRLWGIIGIRHFDVILVEAPGYYLSIVRDFGDRRWRSDLHKSLLFLSIIIEETQSAGLESDWIDQCEIHLLLNHVISFFFSRWSIEERFVMEDFLRRASTLSLVSRFKNTVINWYWYNQDWWFDTVVAKSCKTCDRHKFTRSSRSISDKSRGRSSW